MQSIKDGTFKNDASPLRLFIMRPISTSVYEKTFNVSVDLLESASINIVECMLSDPNIVELKAAAHLIQFKRAIWVPATQTPVPGLYVIYPRKLA